MSRVRDRVRVPDSLDSLWGGCPVYRPRLWILLRALHRLRWPCGEAILSAVFVAKAFVDLDHLRRALTWSAHFAAGHRRWNLALSTLAARGRFVGRAALVGMRSADDLGRLFAVRGEEHLQAASGATILLGFHVGPPYSYVALRAAGHAVTLVGLRCIPERWSRRAWGRPEGENLDLLVGEDQASRATMLHQAYQVLRQGGRLYMTADTVEGGGGREAFRLTVRGRDVVVRSGWLALRLRTGAAVLPVLAHLDGLRAVVTIHPALPGPEPDPARDGAACRDALEALLADYARRFPEQCWSLVG